MHTPKKMNQCTCGATVHLHRYGRTSRSSQGSHHGLQMQRRGPFWRQPAWRMSTSHNLTACMNTVQVHTGFKMNQWLPLVRLPLWTLGFKADTTPPFTSLPFCIVSDFSNTATDYRRKQSTVIPTTKLGYNLSGRESDLVVIRMIGSFHLIWEKTIIVGQTHHIILNVKWVPVLLFNPMSRLNCCMSSVLILKRTIWFIIYGGFYYLWWAFFSQYTSI